MTATELLLIIVYYKLKIETIIHRNFAKFKIIMILYCHKTEQH